MFAESVINTFSQTTQITIKTTDSRHLHLDAQVA